MAISDLAVATTAGALVLVLAAAACGGDDAGASAQSDNGASAEANQAEPATDSGQPTDGATSPTTQGQSEGEITIDPSTLALVWVEIQVRGIGGGGSYIHYTDPRAREAAELALEEVLAEGDGYIVVTEPSEGEPEIQLVDDGGCFLAQPVTIVYDDFTDDLWVENQNMLFNAHARYSQTEYVSLADNGNNAHGGFAKGGVGRDESQQWEIFSDGPLYYKVEATPSLGYFILGAKWTGTSIENFSGEEAAGVVEVACVFVTRIDP